jgi:HAE1 family hydrophobic/amphiphilic exporter-1
MFVMQGPSLSELERASNTLAEKARQIPGLVDVDTSLRVGKPEMAVKLDRPKAADLGVQIADAAEALRLLVGGDQVTTYNEAGEQYEVHLRAQDEDRGSEAAVGQLTVPSSRLGSVTLENIASFSRGAAPSDIRRLNRQRQVTVAANMLPGTSQTAAQAQMTVAASQLGLGSEYRTGYSGRSRELNRTASAFLQALALSLIFMYLVLAAQFESWLHPVTILLSLPLTLPFALLSILIFGQSLNIFSALGMLVLFGVVKKNSILQIDHANQLKEAGLGTREAVVQACRDRLRPILMTTLAFVAGMIPLVVTTGVGSATNHAIGFVVIGGQTLVLTLTLLVTPVVYSLFEDLREARLVRAGLESQARPTSPGLQTKPGLH